MKIKQGLNDFPSPWKQDERIFHKCFSSSWKPDERTCLNLLEFFCFSFTFSSLTVATAPEF